MGLNSVDVHGLDGFLKLLDRRKDIDSRERGLITGRLYKAQLRDSYMLN